MAAQVGDIFSERDPSLILDPFVVGCTQWSSLSCTIHVPKSKAKSRRLGLPWMRHSSG